MTGSVTVTGAPATPTATPVGDRDGHRHRLGDDEPAADGQRDGHAGAHGRLDLDQHARPARRLAAGHDRAGHHQAQAEGDQGRRRRSPSRSRSPASVTLRVKRGSRTVGTIRLAERAGSRSVTLRRMAKGRYSVEIEARDARGNKAAVQRKTVRVKR